MRSFRSAAEGEIGDWAICKALDKGCWSFFEAPGFPEREPCCVGVELEPNAERDFSDINLMLGTMSAPDRAAVMSPPVGTPPKPKSIGMSEVFDS